MKGRISLLLLILVCLMVGRVQSQTILQRGDLVVLAVNANYNSAKDEISFVCFKDILAGTEIQILDAGYENCTTGLWSCGQEGGAKMVRTGGTIPAGTVITFRTDPVAVIYPDPYWTISDLFSSSNANYSVLSANLNINASGDQVYFAQGGVWNEQSTLCTINGNRTSPNAVFPGNNGRILFGFSTSGWATTPQQSSSESALYPGMTCFSMSPTNGTAFNKYTGPLTAATQTTWITRISNTANWTTYSSSANYYAASPIYNAINYTIPILAGGPIPTATWTAPTTALCSNAGSINLNSLITGTTGGTWSGTGVTGSTFDPTGLNGSYNVTYTIQYNSGAGICPIAQTNTINVTGINPPAVTTLVKYCSNSTAIPLSATGTSLLWYTSATGGIGSSTAPTPSITTAGIVNYFVSQTISGCESFRSMIRVNTSKAPVADAVNNQTICHGFNTAAINFSGNGVATYNWVNNTPSIGLPASGSGNIASFVANNTGTAPITATITVTPVSENYAYVANFGSPIALTTPGTVSVINTSAFSYVGNITVGVNPFGVAVSPDASRVYVTNYGALANSVSVINTNTNTVIATIPVGSQPMGIAITPDGTRLYVANQISNNVSVINTATNTVIATIPVSLQPQGVAINSDGSKVYVANVNSNNVSVIGTATNTVTNVIGVGTQPICVAISPDDTRLYVPNFANNNVSVINALTNTVIGTIPVGTNPNGAAVSPDGTRLYVTNQGAFSVSIINTSTNTVIATPFVNLKPQGVAFTPDGTKAYIANFGSNNVTTINTATNTVGSTMGVGQEPHSLGNFIAPNNVCTGDPITFTITVNPKPAIPVATVTQPTCSSPGTITVTAPIGTGFTYSIDGTNFQASPTFSSVSAGSYTVTVKNAEGCSTASPSTITINAPASAPAAPVTTITQPTCAVPTGSIVVTSPTGAGLTYSIDGTNFQSSTTFSNLAPNTYTVTVKDASGCSNTSSAVITAAGSIASPTFTTTQPTCTIATGSITVTSPTGTGLTYSIDGTNFQSSPTFNNISPNTYTVTVKNTGGCSNTSTVTISSAPTMPVPTFTLLQPTCGQPTGSLIVTSPIGATFEYSIDGTNFNFAGTFTGIPPGNYTLTVRNQSGCSNTAPFTITAPSSTLPTPTFTITQPTCLVTTGSISITSPLGSGYTYGLDPALVTNITTFVNLTPNTYTLTVYNGGCTSSAPFTINTVPTPPSAPTVTTPVAYCQNVTATALTANGTNLLWYTSATLGTSSSTAPTPSTTTVSSIPYYVSQTVNGCESPRASIVVDVNATPAVPTISAGGPTTFCSGNNVTLTSSSATNNQWLLDGNTLAGATGSTYPANQNGNYTVTVTNANNCSSTSLPTSVTVNPKPVVFAGIDVYINEGDSAKLQASATGGTVFSYLWSPSIYLSDASILQPWVVKPLVDNIYTLTVTNEHGCSNNDNVLATVLKDIVVPNAFSPNGDNVNDVWDITNLNLYPFCTVEIFARSGQLVHSTVGYSRAWNGTYNGKPLPVGVYYYIINLKNGKPVKSGSVTLLR